jgi:hypothetical protein
MTSIQGAADYEFNKASVIKEVTLDIVEITETATESWMSIDGTEISEIDGVVVVRRGSHLSVVK